MIRVMVEISGRGVNEINVGLPTCYLPKPPIVQTPLTAGPMSSVMVTLANICGALCSTLQSLVNAHYLTAVQ